MALLVLSSSVAARAQTAAPAHSHGNFECLPDGLTRNKSFGCRLLAQPIIDKLPDEPVFWHLTTFATRRAADAAKRRGDAVVSADGRVWLSSIGSRGDTAARGKHVAAIGPLPMPKASAYRVEMYYVIMPPRAHTLVHTHPGPEAWYVLEGEQCLDTPAGVFRARHGERRIAPSVNRRQRGRSFSLYRCRLRNGRIGEAERNEPAVVDHAIVHRVERDPGRKM